VRTASGNRYDVFPYEGAAVPAAHIGRLESIASLFGMTPAAPKAARILELGCGTGANLLPLALDHPHATIVGCDLARTAIASARQMADALGIANIELRHADLADVDEGWGEFDYILCHDVFSWVAPEVRHKILEIQARNLAPHGIGYVSYDALPGWRLHGVAREMMRYHTRHLEGFRETVEQARAMIAMAAEVQDQNPGTYASLIRDEYCLLSGIPDDQLYHLVSEEHHQPLYFHEFLEKVNGATLQWLANAGLERPWLSEVAPAFLRQASAHEQQQYLDFFNNCTFRRALVCRGDVQLCRRPDEQVLRRLWIGLTSAATVESASASGEMRLRAEGREVRTSDPTTSEALRRLDDARPELVSCVELFGSQAALPVDFLMDAMGSGAIDGVLTPFNLTNEIGAFPTTSPLVRLQALQGGLVTNQKSEPVRLSGLMRHVAQRLDGEHDRSALAEDIARQLHSNAVKMDSELVLLLDTAANPSDLTEACVRYFRDHALLIR
jgi:SAM-dependent methyltransferase